MSVKIENLNKSFQKLNILKNISLSINSGEIVSIIGPSGSGKSTLLRCLINLETINSGKVTITPNKNNSSLGEFNSNMGMVFQSFNLFPHKTTLENITESLIIVDKIPKSEADKIATDLLKLVGLEDKSSNYPSTLSGGQKQRVAIARALAKKPQILLFDEPTSALDPEMVKEVLSVIESLKNTGMTMIIVSHEMEFVKQVSDRVVFMDEGEVISFDTPINTFESDNNERISKFLNNF